MSDGASSAQILQAIAELSEEVKGVSQKIDNVEKRLDQKIDGVEERLNQKITKNTEKVDNIDAKLSILSDSILNTQAEVKILKNAK